MTRRPLFQHGLFTSHAGVELSWKIECDALTDEDWKTLALMALERVDPFREVIGVPRGGLRLASEMRQFVVDNGSPYRPASSYPRLIVDDVLTTGTSMREAMTEPDDMGLVVFARGAPPQRVRALFVMPPK